MAIYTIPKFLYTSSIYNYLEKLIDNGTTNYSKIDDAEKEDLACLILEILGPDFSAHDLLCGSDDDYDKTIHYFSKFLKSASKEDAYDLLNQMRKNAIEAYDYHLEQLFNEILDGIAWRRSA